MMKPIPLFSGREAARALGVTHARFNRAVRRGRIHPDCISNSGDGIGDARRKLAENRIRDGKLAEPPVASSLLTALKSEREARQALSKAEAASAAASELQMEWEEQVKRLNMLREKCERANAELANARAQAKGAREKLFQEVFYPRDEKKLGWRLCYNLPEVEEPISYQRYWLRTGKNK